tara:strand:- start:449 stop:694 length:246 start_codon:yes stop_codon:yes gene_type:complete
MKILAQYTDTSTFEVPENIDISSAYDWHIKWDVLYIQLDADSPMIAIEKEHDENHETYRVPNEITFSKDGELVEHLNRGKK